MGWYNITRTWFNGDSDDNWYITQITPGGTPSPEVDDAYEDNDTINQAHIVYSETIPNLRCLDTLIITNNYQPNYQSSYGDWYKVQAVAGQALSVSIVFANANGDLDLQVFNPSQSIVGSSTGTTDSESVTVPNPIAGYYYIFVYGKNNARNSNYTLIVNQSPPQTPQITSVSPATLPPSASPQSITINGSNFLPAGNANASTLVFYDPSNNPHPVTPTSVTATSIQCNLTVGAVTGSWKVKVVNGSVESSPFSFNVTSGGSGVVLTGLSISGPSAVAENNGGQFTATAYFSDNSSSTVTSSTVWSQNSGVASISSSGYFTAYSVSSDTAVTVSASYTLNGVTKTTSANITVANVSSGGGPTTVHPLVNGNFESGSSPWAPSGYADIVALSYPHQGSWYAYLGNANSAVGSFSQFFPLPSGTTAGTLQFYLNIVTAETAIYTAYDTMKIDLVTANEQYVGTIAQFSNLDKGANVNGNYVYKNYDITSLISPYKGQSMYLVFTVQCDTSNITIFRVDDVDVSLTVNSPVSLTGLAIRGPSSIPEGQGNGYWADAIFSDGTTQTISPSSWSENSSVTTISSDGFLSAGLVNSDTTVTVTASYPFDGTTKQATKTVTIVDTNTAHIVTSLVISGPVAINENSSGQFTATAFFANGTSQSVTPIWTDNSVSASISSGGLLSAGEVGGDTTITVSASYTINGVTQNASQDVLIKNVPASQSLASLSISGTSSLNEHSSALYSATAYFSDGSSQVVVPTWATDASSTSITSFGLLSAGEVASDTPATITASYTIGGTTRTAQKNVTVIDTTVAYFWDADTNAGLQAASGIWSGTDANWADANAGSNPLLPWPVWGNDASFIGTGGSYSISVTATQNVNNLSFTNGAYTVSGGALKHFVGPTMVAVDGNASLNLPFTGDTDFVKLGTGTLTLGAPATFTGDTLVSLGTLQLDANDILPASSDVHVGTANGTTGSLAVNGNQTISSLNFQSLCASTNSVSIAAGKTLTISNATTGIAFGVGNYNMSIGGIVATTSVSFVNGGELNIIATNGVFSLEPSGTNNLGVALGILDLSRLSSFTASLNRIRAATIGGYPTNVSLRFALSLATNNNITAYNNIVIGASANGNTYFSGGSNAFTLGVSNVFNADGILIYGGRQSGFMSFRAGASSNLTIRGVSGGISRANLYFGDQANISRLGNGGGGSNPSFSTFDSGGANVDARLNQLILGSGGASGGAYGAATSIFNFGGSNSIVDVNSLCLGYAMSNSAWGTSSSNVVAHSGILTMNGGTLNVNSNFFLGYSADDDQGNVQYVAGVFNFNGGTVNVSSNLFLGYSTNTIGIATGTLNLSNGTFNVGADILSSGINATGTVSLVGATLSLNHNDIGTAATPVNFVAGSGTLANVGEINGGSPLVKTGAGTLILFGTNTYTGSTTVSQGEVMGLTGGACSNSAFTVLAGATNGVGVLTAGGQWFCGALTANVGSCLDFNFTSSTIGSGIAPLQILGNFSYANPTILVRTATSLTNGQYPLIKYGALSGTVISNVTFAPSLSVKFKYSLITNAAQSTLDLLILSDTNYHSALSWAGGNGLWDINVSTNWQSDGVPGYYYQDGRNVILDDTASGASPILIMNAEVVSPAGLSANLTNKNYVLSGSAIAGSTTLDKTGPGSLTLAGTNSFTGNTTISDGTVLVNGNSAASTSLVTVSSGAVLGGTGIHGGNVIVNAGGMLAPGGINNVGRLTLTNNLTLTDASLLFDLSYSAGGASDLVAVGNSVYLTNTNVIQLSGGVTAGDYTLMTYAATNGPGTFVLASVYPNASLVINPTSLVLHVGAGGSVFGLTWNGSVSGTWDAGEMNWTNCLITTNFNAGDYVIFDDSLANNPLVTNATPEAVVAPGSVMFNNSLTNYTIKANLGGTGSLSKFGAATVMLTGTNNYTGNTTVSAGTLTVAGGGAINSPGGTLNIGADVNRSTVILTNVGSSITVQTLLATNNVCGGPTNSIFNFSGGTLTTSNNNGLAANILLASNAGWIVNGNWNLNGGTNIFCNVATNASAWTNLYVGYGVNNLQVNVNPAATWWHAIPANSRSTNTLSLVIGAGNATNNVFTVNGGTLIVTNAVGNKTPVTIGGSVASVSNQVRIINGGQVITKNSFPLNPNGAIGLNLNGVNNSLVVAGTNAAGVRATWNFNTERLYIGSSAAWSNNWAQVDSGGLVTNCGLYMLSVKGCLFITNGGRVYATGLALGRGGANNTITVGGMDGGGNKSLLSFYAGNTAMMIGGGSGSGTFQPGTNNTVRVEAGGLMTNSVVLYIGGYTSGFDSNSIGNHLIITNGGQSFNTAVNIGNQGGCNSNYASIGGGSGGSLLWLSKTNLTIGANAAATNNFITLFSGGMLTNVNSVILGGVNSRVNFNGGTLAAGNNGFLITTNSTAVNPSAFVQSDGAVIDNAGFSVTNRVSLMQDTNSPGGGLTKLGSGTLALLGTNNYTGNTTVSAGILSLQQPTLATNSTVTVAGGATLNLGFTDTNQVAALVVNGVRKAQGVYNNATDPVYLTGSGSLLVQSFAATYPTNITVNLNVSQLNMTWPASHLGWYVQANSVNLANPNFWHDVPNSQNVTNLVIPINPTMTNVFYRLSNTSNP